MFSDIVVPSKIGAQSFWHSETLNVGTSSLRSQCPHAPRSDGHSPILANFKTGIVIPSRPVGSGSSCLFSSWTPSWFMTNRIHLSCPIYLFEFSRPPSSRIPVPFATRYFEIIKFLVEYKKLFDLPDYFIYSHGLRLATYGKSGKTRRNIHDHICD